MDRLDDFIRRVRSNRISKNQTQDDVAVALGISKQYLSEIERGTRRPSPEMAVRLCDALDIDEDFYYASAGIVPDDIMHDYSTSDIMTMFFALRRGKVVTGNNYFE